MVAPVHFSRGIVSFDLELSQFSQTRRRKWCEKIDLSIRAANTYSSCSTVRDSHAHVITARHNRGVVIAHTHTHTTLTLTPKQSSRIT